jgi:hypothetical protein
LKHASWTVQGPLRNRTDIPSWYKETDLWINTGWESSVLNATEGDPDIVLKRLSGIAKLFNVNNTRVTIHWYCWHQIPFDTDYPDFLPGMFMIF